MNSSSIPLTIPINSSQLVERKRTGEEEAEKDEEREEGGGEVEEEERETEKRLRQERKNERVNFIFTRVIDKYTSILFYIQPSGT